MGSTIGIQRGLTPRRHGAVLTTTLAALDIGKSTSRSSKLMTAVQAGRVGTMAGQMARSLGAVTTRTGAAPAPGIMATGTTPL
mmetsp:Transcript_6960/g.15816  ORF Transcript_6960/g.15816 Transcript_6960/m.15816 type:complete len:83 (-) Transcript_6960:1113-1361(-)